MQLSNAFSKVQELETELKVVHKKSIENDKHLRDTSTSILKEQLESAEKSLQKEKLSFQEEVLRAKEEMVMKFNEIKEINVKYEEELNTINRILSTVLKTSAGKCDFLSNIDFNELTANQKLSNIEKLVKYLLYEKEYTEKKYKQLMNLHNETIGMKNKEANSYNIDQTQRLLEENNELKREIVLLKNEK